MAPLTFGIELEFILKTRPTGVNNPADLGLVYDDDLCLPIDSSSSSSDSGTDTNPYSTATRDLENYSELAHEVHTRMADILEEIIGTEVRGAYKWGMGAPRHAWVITDDWSIKTPQNTEYVYFPIELNSPPLPFTAESLAYVELVVEALTLSFHVSTNRSCGFHVHVGDGQTSFPFTTIRNLMAILFSFEPQLLSLHPWHRWNGQNCHALRGPIDERTGKTLPREGSQDGTTPLDISTEKKLYEILQSPNLSHLAATGHSSCKRSAYNIYRVDRENYKGSQTVEFRQHEGTLDPARITNWISVCVRLVSISNSTPSILEHYVFRNMLRRNILTYFHGQKDVVWFLADILKLPEQAAYYKNALTLPRRHCDGDEEES